MGEQWPEAPSPLSSRPAMNEIVPSDVLQRLDERHEHLLAELDILNDRLESALGAFGKSTATEQASHTLARTESSS